MCSRMFSRLRSDNQAGPSPTTHVGPVTGVKLRAPADKFSRIRDRAAGSRVRSRRSEPGPAGSLVYDSKHGFRRRELVSLRHEADRHRLLRRGRAAAWFVWDWTNVPLELPEPGYVALSDGGHGGKTDGCEHRGAWSVAVGGLLGCVVSEAMTAGPRPRYTWRRCGRKVNGVKGQSLRLRRADARKRVSCQVVPAIAGQKLVATSNSLRTAARRR